MALDTLFRGEPFEHHAATTDLDLGNPYKGLPEQFYGAGGGPDVTQALTGVASFTALGTATMQSDKPELAMAGLAATAAVGTPGIAHTVGLTGVFGTSALGNVLSGIPVALTGFTITTAVGNVIRTIPIDLTGLGATGASGNVLAPHANPLPGVSGQGVSGLISGAAGETRPAGQQSVGALGTLGLQSQTSITGNGGTYAVGSTVAGLAAPIQAVTAAVGQGSIALGLTVAISGVGATQASGSVLAGHSAPILGLAAACEVGFIRLTGLTGVQAGVLAGSVVAGRGTSGNQASATIGAVGMSLSVTIGGVQAVGTAGRFVSQRQPGRDPTMVGQAPEQIFITGV